MKCKILIVLHFKNAMVEIEDSATVVEVGEATGTGRS